MFEHVEVGSFSGMLVGKSQTIDAPGLTAGPGGICTVALAGLAPDRRTCFRIHEEGVVAGPVASEGIGDAGLCVAQCDVTILGLSCLVASPVEQGQVEKTVYDVAVVVFCTHLAPGLKELSLLLKAGDEIVCGQEGSLPSMCVPFYLPGGYAAWRVEEAHVMMIDFNPLFDSLSETFCKDTGSMGENLVLALKIAQPELAGPEAGSPFHVVNCLVDTIYAAGILALVSVEGKVPSYDRNCSLERILPLPFTDFTVHCLLLCHSGFSDSLPGLSP